MFSKRKEEQQMMQKMMESLEISNNNNALIASGINHLIESEKKTELEENMDPDKAAYALNLCTVSVSQIIDYEDLVILEQEYDSILNNLNLENIPKDEALLNILKEILDTVTFFRIQAGDRKMIEKEHQQKMKNAIWSAVPSLGMIVAGGNVWTALISIASQVGVGYMNYRRAKAASSLEYEKQRWQLQRSAIEQLNGLRRELFDTSWRLADKYKFKEEKRLTEKQISQYNEILMDPDDLRRYERLESISKYFEAYPPFWYYLGHAANMVSQNASKQKENSIADTYTRLAKQHFEQYFQYNNFGLLREDLVKSSCALEYIDLLDISTDRDKILKLLNSAVQTSGGACDVLQLCSLVYLRMGDISKAVGLLKYLVNEGYNEIINAQMLSFIYVRMYMEKMEPEIEDKYKLLASRVKSELLFPFPDTNDEIEELTVDFEKQQKIYLLRKYAVVIERLINRYTVKFNKCIPLPIENRVYAESFFIDTEDSRTERLNQYKQQFNRERDKVSFVERLESAGVFFEWITLFNEMLNQIEELYVMLIGQDEEMVSKVINKLAENIEYKFKQKVETFSKLQAKMSDKFEVEDFEELFTYSFEYFSRNVIQCLVHDIQKAISSFKDMSAVSNAEIKLKKFCDKNGYPDPDTLLGIFGDRGSDEADKIYLSSEILGGAAFEKAEESKLVKNMAKYINEKIAPVILGNKEDVYVVLKFGIGKQRYKDFFQKKKYVSTYRSVLVGAIVDKSFGKSNLIFTSRGIILEEMFTGLTICPAEIKYADITCDNGGLNLGGKIYKNKNLNIELLYEIIQELTAMKKEKDSSEDEIPLGIEAFDVPLIGIFDVDSISDAFEFQILKCTFMASDGIECYGNVLRGRDIHPGDTLEAYRENDMIGVVTVRRYQFNGNDKNDATIWVTYGVGLLSGDHLVLTI